MGKIDDYIINSKRTKNLTIQHEFISETREKFRGYRETVQARVRELEEAQITRVNIAKWGAILNYSYIPADEADDRRHKKLLRDYGVSDAKAFMTQFYPDIKREIIASWARLFDDRVQLGNDWCYGTIWEVKQEWITAVVD